MEDLLPSEWLSRPEYGETPFRGDVDYPRAASWLSAPKDRTDAIVLGVPFSALSLSGARCDLLPAELRRALWRFSTFGRGVDLVELAAQDVGDLALWGLDAGESLEQIRRACSKLSGAAPRALIGGDNSITAPAMLGTVGSGGGLITFDAHHDLRDYGRDGLSNGSPVRVLLDAGVAGPRIWQIGIRDFANSAAYSGLAESAGIKSVSTPDVVAHGMEGYIGTALEDLTATDGIYVDMDIDVVERALAPAAPGAQPGGLQPIHLQDAAFRCGLHPAVKCLDIVEVDPKIDVAGSTVRLAASVLLSFLAGVASRPGRAT